METRDDRAAYLETLRRDFLCRSCFDGLHECVRREEGVIPTACRCEACDAIPFLAPVDARPVELGRFFKELDEAMGNPPSPEEDPEGWGHGAEVECARCKEIVPLADTKPDEDKARLCLPCVERSEARWIR